MTETNIPKENRRPFESMTKGMTTLNPEVQDPEFGRGLEEAVDQLRVMKAMVRFDSRAVRDALL